MASHVFKSFFFVALFSNFAPQESKIHSTDAPKSRIDRELERVPASILKSRESRQKLLQKVTLPQEVFRSVIQKSVAWKPKSIIKVAFLGGDATLHKTIEDATKELTNTCNIKFDFWDKDKGTYRTWSRSDQRFAADVRISFYPEEGYWSLVGTESIDQRTAEPQDAWGGRPYQSSMNFEGFDVGLNLEDLPRTVRHEFMHALGLHHEHQHPSGICAINFRWEDDPGYILKKDERGYCIPNRGKNPGIYTYMAALNPSIWTRPAVDHNLKPLPSNTAEATKKVDSASIMLYRYPDFFYLRPISPCIPSGNGENLSIGDKEALRVLYPYDLVASNRIIAEQKSLFERVQRASVATPADKAEFKIKTANLLK